MHCIGLPEYLSSDGLEVNATTASTAASPSPDAISPLGLVKLSFED